MHPENELEKLRAALINNKYNIFINKKEVKMFIKLKNI